MTFFSEKQCPQFKCFSPVLTFHISPAVNYSKKPFPVCLLCHVPNGWTFRVTKPSCLPPCGFFFIFFFLLVVCVGFFFWWCWRAGEGRNLRGRQAAKGVSSAGLSNGFADMDSCNCCLLLPCQEQPIRRQVLKVKTVQASNLLNCTGLQEKACAYACVF